MSEIPKLLKQTPKDIEYYCEDDLYIANKSLKEVNAFWERYKSSPLLFANDFPEKWQEIKYNVNDDMELYRGFWVILHDMLYRVKEE